MKQLQQLTPVLEGFNVRVLNGKVLTKPDCNKNQYACHMEREEAWCECSAYNQAQELCKMLRVMEFVPHCKDYYFNHELYTDGHGYGQRNADILGSILSYSDFAKLKPQLWMYIPCNEEGEVLEEPEYWWAFKRNELAPVVPSFKRCQEYQTAKDRVLFEGWEVKFVNEKEITLFSNHEDPYILRFHKDKVLLGTRDLTSLEDAFIAVDHYMDLNKLNS